MSIEDGTEGAWLDRGVFKCFGECPVMLGGRQEEIGMHDLEGCGQQRRRRRLDFVYIELYASYYLLSKYIVNIVRFYFERMIVLLNKVCWGSIARVTCVSWLSVPSPYHQITKLPNYEFWKDKVVHILLMSAARGLSHGSTESILRIWDSIRSRSLDQAIASSSSIASRIVSSHCMFGRRLPLNEYTWTAQSPGNAFSHVKTS